MTTTIKDIYTGKLDARNEVLNPNNNFYKSFIMPPSVDMEELINGDKFFIKGFNFSLFWTPFSLKYKYLLFFK